MEMGEDLREERLHAVVLRVRRVQVLRRPALLRGGEDGREVELLVGGAERREEVEGLDMHFVGAGVRPVDLVDEHDGLQPQRQRLGGHEFRLRQRALGRVHQQHHAVHHREDAFHLAAEIGMAGRVDDVDAGMRPVLLPVHAGAFRENGDAALALQVVGVHHALGHLLVLAEGAGLAQELVDQRRLPMVDMGDDRDIPNRHMFRRGMCGFRKGATRSVKEAFRPKTRKIGIRRPSRANHQRRGGGRKLGAL